MTRKVLVVGHSDGDGHVIAEQTRRNLSFIPGFEVVVVVDPMRTQGHASWRRLNEIPEIQSAEWVVFVDLMFSPTTFVRESDALVKFAETYPRKRFFVIDHHPLPLRRLTRARNVRTAYRPDVFECTIGPRSGLMILAAIDERQRDTIEPIRRPYHDRIARGLRRAAAPGGDLPGERLMSLLRFGRWDVLLNLDADDDAHHRLVRGRRATGTPPTRALTSAKIAADNPRELLLNDAMVPSRGSDSRSAEMPYDLAAERYILESDEPPRYANAPVPARDLEVLVTLLEVAALSLTDEPGATFTLNQLVGEARSIVGDGLEIDERDVKIVLEKASFVSWAPGRVMSLK